MKWNVILVVSILFIMISCTGCMDTKEKGKAEEEGKVSTIEFDESGAFDIIDINETLKLIVKGDGNNLRIVNCAKILVSGIN